MSLSPCVMVKALVLQPFGIYDRHDRTVDGLSRWISSEKHIQRSEEGG